MNENIIKTAIGRVSVNMGEYDSTVPYKAKNRVYMYGCEFESLKDDNENAPATFDGVSTITLNTEDWKLVSGSTELWLYEHGYKSITAEQVESSEASGGCNVIQFKAGDKIIGEIIILNGGRGERGFPAEIKVNGHDYTPEDGIINLPDYPSLADYYTKEQIMSWVRQQGYLTQHQSLEALATKVSVQEAVDDLNILAGTVGENAREIISIKRDVNSVNASIEAIIDHSSNTVTSRMLANVLTSDEGVMADLKAEFATEIDQMAIASAVKTSIAADFDEAEWQTWVGHLKGDIVTIGQISEFVNEHEAEITSLATFGDNDGNITAKSMASVLANSTDAVTILSVKFKPTTTELENSVSQVLDASVEGSTWSAYVQQIAQDHEAVGTLTTKVETIEGKSYVEASMIAGVKDSSGKITAASIIAAVNGAGSEVVINADKIKVGDITIRGNQISDIDQVIANKITAAYLNQIFSSVSDVRTWNKLELTEGTLHAMSSVGTGGFGARQYHTKISDAIIDGYKLVVNGSGTSTTTTKLWTLDQDGYLGTMGGINFWDEDGVVQGNIYGAFGTFAIRKGVNIYSNESVSISAAGILQVFCETDIDGDCYADNFRQNSDQTLKNKIEDVAISAEEIANAPSIRFTWKNEDKNKGTNVGTIAQYWRNVLPELVSENRDKKLALNYPVLATLSAINLAKEVVELKGRVSRLEGAQLPIY